MSAALLVAKVIQVFCMQGYSKLQGHSSSLGWLDPLKSPLTAAVAAQVDTCSGTHLSSCRNTWERLAISCCSSRAGRDSACSAQLGLHL